MFKNLLRTVVFTLAVGNAWAAPHVELANVDIDTSPEALRSGAMIMTGTCIQCHSMKYVKYRHLADLGFSQKEIDNLRGENDMNAGLARVMDMEAVRSMFGLVPPDLSLMTKARRGGSRYVYSLFAGFQADENGNVENHVFPGIQMPDIFSISLAASDKEREAILANIADVSAFLEWASDPSGAERESLGYYVLAYIVALSVLYYLLKKRIWQRVKRRNEIAQEQSAAASTNATLQS